MQLALDLSYAQRTSAACSHAQESCWRRQHSCGVRRRSVCLFRRQRQHRETVACRHWHGQSPRAHVHIWSNENECTSTCGDGMRWMPPLIAAQLCAFGFAGVSVRARAGGAHAGRPRERRQRGVRLPLGPLGILWIRRQGRDAMASRLGRGEVLLNICALYAAWRRQIVRR